MQFTKRMPVAGLLTGAIVWGLIWYPYRVLEHAGVSGALAATLTYAGYGLMLLAIAGALVMLWQPQLGWPLPRSVAEWIGLSAGVMFALSNELLTLKEWCGGAMIIVAGLLSDRLGTLPKAKPAASACSSAPAARPD